MNVNNKFLSILALKIAAFAISVLGCVFAVVSIINNIHFYVFGSSIHGAIFGAVILFLGIRYFLSVNKLKKEVYKESSEFSWENFKKKKIKKY